MNELQQFLAMLERAGVGHGTRVDHNPAGTAVQVEAGDDPGEFTVAEFGFDGDGNLKAAVCYPGDGD